MIVDAGKALRRGVLTLMGGALLTGVLSATANADGKGTHRVRIEGEGAVTVIFESGLGDTLDVWRGVQTEVARGCARTFSYNRSGYPGSSRPRGARDTATIVEELRTELRERRIEPPYVLVGHSLGGLYMEYFASRHAGEVRGLLLVDATHWQHEQRMRQDSPTTYRMVKALMLLATSTMRAEIGQLQNAGRQVEQTSAPNSIPTIVLSSTRASPGEIRSVRELMVTLQTETAERFNARRHEFVDGSTHYIQLDRPDRVVQAIKELVGCPRRHMSEGAAPGLQDGKIGWTVPGHSSSARASGESGGGNAEQIAAEVGLHHAFTRRAEQYLLP
jgi:pimeloyl-ACP methyl ester carboxylesterase